MTMEECIIVGLQYDVGLFDKYEEWTLKYNKNKKCDWCEDYQRATEKCQKNQQDPPHLADMKQLRRRTNRKIIATIAAMDWEWYAWHFFWDTGQSTGSLDSEIL